MLDLNKIVYVIQNEKMNCGGKKMNKIHSFRLSDEAMGKLTDDARKAGISKTTYLEKLILEGEVRTLYNGKQLIEIVAKAHDAINQDTMAVRKDLNKINQNLEDLQRFCNKKNLSMIQPLVTKTNMTLENIEERYWEKVKKNKLEIVRCQFLK